MEIISPADVLFLKVALGASVAYGTQRLISYANQKPSVIEPLIPFQNTTSTPSTKTPRIATRSIRKALEQAEKSCIYFYGSQTRTAEKLASVLAKEALATFGITGLVADLDDYDFDDLLSLPEQYAVIFLVSTYGEGEPTDNAISFNRYCANITTKDVPNTSLHFAAFGLGNSSYQYYNEMVKRINSTLTDSGAQRIGAVGFGDDGEGSLEDDFMAWKDTMLPLLAKHLGFTATQRVPVVNFKVMEEEVSPQEQIFEGEPSAAQLRGKMRGPWTSSNPFPAHIIKSKQLFKNTDRKCLHMEFDTSESTMTYETGDHLGIWPENSDVEIERFLQVFGLTERRNSVFKIQSLDPTVKVPFPSPTTYDAAARYYLDICAPISRYSMTSLADFSTDETTKAELLHLSKDPIAFENLGLGSPNSWTSIPVSILFEMVGKLQPRYYSISSSSLKSRKVISITAVVESQSQPEWSHEFKGVSTNYLFAQHCRCTSKANADGIPSPTHHLSGPRYKSQDISSLIHVRRSNFRLPKSTSVPIIMIGPGTGVAPFRAFVQERAWQNKLRPVGRTMLFYGCRQQDEDFLYQDEWKALEKSFVPGIFSLHVAFSRQDKDKKFYVQHLLEQEKKELRELILRNGACIYVCGDAHRMAKDVFKTMTRIISEDNSLEGNIEQATNYLKGLKKDKRWVEDVW